MELMRQATPGVEIIDGPKCYPEAITLTGTVSSSGTTVTGTGTKFLRELFRAGSQTPYFPFPVTDQGNWNASTNSPALIGSTGTEGYEYTVSVTGNTNVDGERNWMVGDKIAFYKGKWRKATMYDNAGPPIYKYLYSAVRCELMEIDHVLSDTVLILKTAFSGNLAAEDMQVAGISPNYTLISLNPIAAGNKVGTVGNAAITIDANAIPNYSNVGGLKPICVDGTTGNLQVTTQF